MTTYAWFVRGSDHAAMCRQSIASVRKVDPRAQCFVFTDERERQWEVPCGVGQLEPGLPIMMANIEAQIAALSVAVPNEPVVTLDTDIIVQQPLGRFHQGDITVTWRDHVGLDGDGEKVEGVASQMPYNYGVMMFAPGLAALESLIFIRERIRQMHGGYRNWYGNQLALVELCGPRPTFDRSTDQRRIPWTASQFGRLVTIQKLPCELFNYTPQSLDDRIDMKAVLHFKGKARELMQPFAERMGFAQ